MEGQQPKPRRDWRSFGKEYVIVVLGVATALAAQQAVDWWNWRGQVAEAREVIATEMAHNLVAAADRLSFRGCTDRRLDQMAQIVDAAAKTGSLPPVGRIGTPPRNTWQYGAWESVVASQTATHFPRQQLAGISGAYKIVQRLEEFSHPEVDTWSELYSLSGPGRRFDAASESELRKALSNARSINGIYFYLSAQLFSRVKALHLPFSKGDLASIAAIEHPPVPAPPPTQCRPIGPAPAFYGQGVNYIVRLANGKEITLDDGMEVVHDFSAGAEQ